LKKSPATSALFIFSRRARSTCRSSGPARKRGKGSLGRKEGEKKGGKVGGGGGKKALLLYRLTSSHSFMISSHSFSSSAGVRSERRGGGFFGKGKKREGEGDIAAAPQMRCVIRSCRRFTYFPTKRSARSNGVGGRKKGALRKEKGERQAAAAFLSSLSYISWGHDGEERGFWEGERKGRREEGAPAGSCLLHTLRVSAILPLRRV